MVPGLDMGVPVFDIVNVAFEAALA